MPIGELHPKHRIRQELDDRALYFNCVFPRHVRISGSSFVIKTVCSKWAEGIPSAVQTVQPSSSRRTPAPSRIDHRLDRERHSRLQARTAPAFAVIWHLRFFVQLPSHAVTDKFAHDAEVRCDLLHPRSPHKRRPVDAFTSEADRPSQRVFGHAQQFLGRSSIMPTGTVAAVSPTQPSSSHRCRASRCRRIGSAAGCRCRGQSRRSARCKCCRGKRDARADSPETRSCTPASCIRSAAAWSISLVEIPGRISSLTRSRISLAVRQACRILSISRPILIGIMPLVSIKARDIGKDRFAIAIPIDPMQGITVFRKRQRAAGSWS